MQTFIQTLPITVLNLNQSTLSICKSNISGHWISRDAVTKDYALQKSYKYLQDLKYVWAPNACSLSFLERTSALFKGNSKVLFFGDSLLREIYLHAKLLLNNTEKNTSPFNPTASIDVFTFGNGAEFYGIFKSQCKYMNCHVGELQKALTSLEPNFFVSNLWVPHFMQKNTVTEFKEELAFFFEYITTLLSLKHLIIQMPSAIHGLRWPGLHPKRLASYRNLIQDRFKKNTNVSLFERTSSVKQDGMPVGMVYIMLLGNI